MGDRSNPIKFGPEWLRNFSTERRTQTTSTVTSSTTFATVAGSAIISTTSSASSTATSTATLGAAGGGAASNVNAHTSTNTAIPVAGAGATASNVSSQSSSNTSQHNPKILLAKLRYGREEMLALYDKETALAPSDLKYNDLLYKPKEQPPMALNSTFDDELRESMRNNQPPPQATDRGVGRSRSGPAPNEGRGRGRLYHRQLSGGRGQWSTGNPRMLGYSPGPEDQSMSRLWGPVNVRPRSPTRNGTEAEWGSQRVFRSKRMNTPNNWRAQTRDENEEWRLDSRPRSLQDKRDRGWNDRTVDKSWNSNRRPWVGSGQNEESLPEWAVGNAEANPGTFDSSGAFHGYSNDDSSLSRPQESSYSLTRSHTHGSFARSKTTDEGAEKDNSKSTKKFDATEVKFKRVSFKQSVDADTANDNSTSDTHKVPNTNEEENATYDSETVSENAEAPVKPPKSPDNNKTSENYNANVYNSTYGEKNSFDALMRSNINLDEGTNDRSNFQSVMIASNNSLRQKHQNIVPSENSPGTSNLTRSYLQMLHHNSNQQSVEEGSSHQPHEVQLVEQICDMTLKDDNKITSSASSIMMNTSTSIASGMSSINSMAQIPSPNMQMLMANSALTKQQMHMNTQSAPAPGMHQLPIVPRMNSNLNPNMGLQMESGNNPIGMRLPMHGLPVPNPPMSNPAMGGTALPPSGIIGFPPSSGVPNTSTDSNSSLFLGPNPNNSIPPNDIQMPGHGAPNNPFPLHAMQQRSNMQPSAYRASLFPNMMQPPPPPPAPNNTNLADQWYYEDPKKTIQGPFTPKEMYTWYRAGFFGPSLMVRRAIDTHMRPLGSFGPIVPFAQDMLPPFPFGALESHNMQGPMDSMLNPQQNLAMDVNSLMGNLPSNANPGLDSMQFPVGHMNNTPFTPQPMEYPWGQPTSSSELMWMQPMNDVRNESRVNNLPPFFWDHQQGGGFH